MFAAELLETFKSGIHRIQFLFKAKSIDQLALNLT
jgi:hypothetical protein